MLFKFSSVVLSDCCALSDSSCFESVLDVDDAYLLSLLDFFDSLNSLDFLDFLGSLGSLDFLDVFCNFAPPRCALSEVALFNKFAYLTGNKNGDSSGSGGAGVAGISVVVSFISFKYFVLYNDVLFNNLAKFSKV